MGISPWSLWPHRQEARIVYPVQVLADCTCSRNFYRPHALVQQSYRYRHSPLPGASLLHWKKRVQGSTPFQWNSWKALFLSHIEPPDLLSWFRWGGHSPDSNNTLDQFSWVCNADTCTNPQLVEIPDHLPPSPPPPPLQCQCHRNCSRPCSSSSSLLRHSRWREGTHL